MYGRRMIRNLNRVGGTSRFLASPLFELELGINALTVQCRCRISEVGEEMLCIPFRSMRKRYSQRQFSLAIQP